MLAYESDQTGNWDIWVVQVGSGPARGDVWVADIVQAPRQ
jgi:hypothetical protein